MRLEIRNLYGHFDYDLTLMPSGITILTGPNGFGKSTVLRCIQALSNSNVDFFGGLVFDSIKVITDDGYAISIEKSNDQLYINGHLYLLKKTIVRPRENQRLRENKVIVTPADDNEHIQEDLQSMARAGGIVHLIREQRLVKEKKYYQVINGTSRMDRKFTNAIEDIKQDLTIRIHRTANLYSELATKLDSSFPFRLLGENDEKGLSKEEYIKLYDSMRQKLKIMNENGVSEFVDQGELPFKQEDARVLKIFFQDFDKKYEVYAPLMERLTLFKDIIQRRFKFKELRLSPTRILEIIDTTTNKEIPLSALSSGEQEIIVLFYELIFNSEENMLILIDEPEISLHIAWQIMFIEDLKKIVALNRISALVATHSADIIGGNRDVQIDLGELYNNGLNNRSEEQ